jgi:hypothetical protein
MLWKMEGLSEYDVRRPMVPTGTNLLGLVKHLASIEFGYFGDTFGRPPGEPLPWFEPDAEPNADMWATPEESREMIIGLYHRAWAHSDATFDALPLDASGHVPWWPEDRNPVTLHHIAVRMIGETSRHAGQADIVRELIDGAAGWLPEKDNLPAEDKAWWANYRDRLEHAARQADGLAGGGDGQLGGVGEGLVDDAVALGQPDQRLELLGAGVGVQVEGQPDGPEADRGVLGHREGATEVQVAFGADRAPGHVDPQ